MSHIRIAGRPAKAGREWPAGADSLSNCAFLFAAQEGIEPTSPLLTWRVPFQEIVEKIQTVDGIAKLAGVTRKTVYRRKIEVGGWAACVFVFDRRRGRPSSFVTHSDPLHPLNFGLRLNSPRSWLNRGVMDVVVLCQNYFHHGRKTVQTTFLRRPTEENPATPLEQEFHAKYAIRNANWKRQLKFHPSVNPGETDDAKLKELKEQIRLGKATLYHPPGRVTAKMICGHFDISRCQFYRWKDSLLKDELALLKDAMRPQRKKIQAENEIKTKSGDFENDVEFENVELQPAGGRRYEVDLNSEGGSKFVTEDSD
jgi:hypothetical protein